jgi:palmitoyltransferase
MGSAGLAAERWVSRSIPPLLLGVTAYSIYVIVYSLSIQYLLHHTKRAHPAIAVIAIYFVLLIPYLASGIRLVLTTMFDPGYIPQNVPRSRSKEGEIGILDRNGILDGTIRPPRGVERFYSKDTFICDYRGLPNFCDKGCYNWKPARTHHCSQVGRCVRRMDVSGVCPREFWYNANIYDSISALGLAALSANATQTSSFSSHSTPLSSAHSFSPFLSGVWSK